MTEIFKERTMLNYRAKVEYTNLKNPPSKVIKNLAKEAINLFYGGVCVLNHCTNIVATIRENKKAALKIVTVAGFPPVQAYPLIATNPMYQYALGHYNKKEFEHLRNIFNNSDVDELDVVFPMSLYTVGRRKRILWLLRGIKKRFKKPVKVIIELGTIFKKEESLKEICFILEEAGIDFVKTNTGLLPQKFEDLADNLLTLIKCTTLPIKASGGIRTVKQAETLSALGIARIGTSKLVEEDTNG